MKKFMLGHYVRVLDDAWSCAGEQGYVSDIDNGEYEPRYGVKMHDAETIWFDEDELAPAPAAPADDALAARPESNGSLVRQLLDANAALQQRVTALEAALRETERKLEDEHHAAYTANEKLNNAHDRLDDLGISRGEPNAVYTVSGRIDLLIRLVPSLWEQVAAALRGSEGA